MSISPFTPTSRSLCVPCAGPSGLAHQGTVQAFLAANSALDAAIGDDGGQPVPLNAVDAAADNSTFSTTTHAWCARGAGTYKIDYTVGITGAVGDLINGSPSTVQLRLQDTGGNLIRIGGEQLVGTGASLAISGSTTLSLTGAQCFHMAVEGFIAGSQSDAVLANAAAIGDASGANTRLDVVRIL